MEYPEFKTAILKHLEGEIMPFPNVAPFINSLIPKREDQSKLIQNLSIEQLIEVSYESNASYFGKSQEQYRSNTLQIKLTDKGREYLKELKEEEKRLADLAEREQNKITGSIKSEEEKEQKRKEREFDELVKQDTLKTNRARRRNDRARIALDVGAIVISIISLLKAYNVI